MALSGEKAFVEWTMGLKIKGIEFVYPGTTPVGPTFAPVPVVGGFVRWLYRRFVT